MQFRQTLSRKFFIKARESRRAFFNESLSCGTKDGTNHADFSGYDRDWL